MLGAAKLQNFATAKYNPKKKNWHNSVDQLKGICLFTKTIKRTHSNPLHFCDSGLVIAGKVCGCRCGQLRSTWVHSSG